MKKENRNYDYEMGKFIWSLVEKTGLKREELAEKLGVSTRTIGFYCSGQRMPEQRRLLQIIKFVGGIKAENIPF